MKNQIGRSVKVIIFGIFEIFFCNNNNKENIFGFFVFVEN
jgi:hypothetical protein